jgi:hypothetical protein
VGEGIPHGVNVVVHAPDFISELEAADEGTTCCCDEVFPDNLEKGI